MSRICSVNADVAYLFHPLGLFFTDKVSQYRQQTCVLEHPPGVLVHFDISEGQANDRLSRVLEEYRN
jgi:hypothetical protein